MHFCCKSIYVMGVFGPLTGQTPFYGSCRAARRARVAAHARARHTGRASPGTVVSGSGCVWARLKPRAFGRAAVLRAKCPSIFMGTERGRGGVSFHRPRLPFTPRLHSALLSSVSTFSMPFFPVRAVASLCRVIWPSAAASLSLSDREISAGPGPWRRGQP